MFRSSARWPDAIAKYRAAVEGAPLESLYQHQLAVALTRSGALQEGLAAFTEIVGRAEAHYNVGYILKEQGKLLEAEEQFQRALALKPELAPAGKMLARVRQERGVPVQVAAKPSANATPTAVERRVTPAAATQAAATQAASTQSAANNVQPAVWQPRTDTEGEANASGFGLSSPGPDLTPQQLEQWRNQKLLQQQQ